MFLPPIWTCALPEHTSPTGSASLTRVKPPLPSGTVSPLSFCCMVTPLVCPEIRLRAPGVEGPNVVPYELSFMA